MSEERRENIKAFQLHVSAASAGERLRLIRLTNDLSLLDMAKRLGCSPDALHKAESGELPGTSVMNIAERAARAFNIPAEAFYANEWRIDVSYEPINWEAEQ